MNRGMCTHTISGRSFWLESPQPEDIDINDVAHALSLQCRWNGHVTEFYSVAQHSVFVSKVCKPENALYGLLHDLAEAYLGDVITPVKRLIKVSYEPLEQGILRAAALKYNFDMESGHEDVKKADEIALVTEARDLAVGATNYLKRPSLPVEEKIIPFSPKVARTAFLNRFYELRHQYEKPRVEGTTI